MRIKLLILSLFISLCGFSQKAYLDSLWKVWNNPNESDSVRLRAMYDFAWDGYLYSQPDSSYYYSKQMFDFAVEKNQVEFQAKALNLQFNYFLAKGDLTKAAEKNDLGFKLREKIGDKIGMAVACTNYGVLYQIQGDYAKAIDYYTQSLKYNEEAKNKSGVGTSLHNIGHLYQEQLDYTKALEYYFKSLKIRQSVNDLIGVSNSHLNIGSVYHSMKQYDEAIKYISKSLKISKELNYLPGVAASLGNMGMICQGKGEYDKAIDYFHQSLAIQEEIDDKQTIAISFLNIGSIYFEKKEYIKAIEFFKKSLKLDLEIGDVSGIRNASKALYTAYKLEGNISDALNMHELYIKMNDSINSESSKKELVRQEFKYEYEKKVISDSIRAVEEKKVVAAQFRQEQTQRYFLYALVILMLVFGGFIFYRFRISQKQKRIIEEQKQIVEQKQREILDSIHYAGRIQQSLLPNEKYIDKHLKRLSKK